MVRLQISLQEKDPNLLRHTAVRSGQSVADLVREAVRRVWLWPTASGSVALWDGIPGHALINHNVIYEGP